MEYSEFLKLPEIKEKFKSMLNEEHEHFMTSRFNREFDKEHLELMSIKLAFISTDLYFTSIHNTSNIK